MGQQPSKEEVELERIKELGAESDQAYLLYTLLRDSPGSDPAAIRAAYNKYLLAINTERAAQLRLSAEWRAREQQTHAPTPTPLPEPDAHAAAAPSSVGSMEPVTPVAGTSAQQGQRGRSSSSEEGAPAGDADGSEVVPLLMMEIGGPARGLRRRHALTGS